MDLDKTSARAFNSSLKNAIKEITGQKVRVEIINSYKFPHCWVRVHAETKFGNDFRLRVFDGCGFDRKGLMNDKDVSYGNIRDSFIFAHVPEWERIVK
jgi:hypothetical protein